METVFLKALCLLLGLGQLTAGVLLLSALVVPSCPSPYLPMLTGFGAGALFYQGGKAIIDTLKD